MENNNIKKKFIALVNACGTRDDILKMIENNMNLLLDYVCAVYNMETQLPILHFRLEGEDYRDAVMELDLRRRRAHNAAISATTALCRIAAMRNAAPMFDGVFDMGDCSFDRNIIGDFCVAAVNALVMDRKKPVTIQSMLEAANN